MNGSDPIRRLAQERGRCLGELGVRPEDESWSRQEAEALASLTTPSLRLRLPRALERLLHVLSRARR